MEAARAAGIWAIGVVPPYLERAEHGALLRERGAHLIIHDPNALTGLVGNLGEHLEMGAEEKA